MDDLTPRVAVLEQIARETHDALGEIRAELRALRGDVTAIRESNAGLNSRLTGLETKVAQLPTSADYNRLESRFSRVEGMISQIPNVWQMAVAVSMGPGIVTGVILLLFRTFGAHG